MTSYKEANATGVFRLIRLIVLIGMTGVVIGTVFHWLWNAWLVPSLHWGPLVNLWRTVMRATELVAFLTLWRAVK